MAKSEGNFLTLDSAFVGKGIDPLVYRFLVHQTHYRKPMEYSQEAVAAGQNGLNHLRNQIRTLQDAGSPADSPDTDFVTKFKQTINNDLNLPQAMAVVQDLLKSDLDAGRKLATVFDFDRVLGLDLARSGDPEQLPAEIETLRQERIKARKEKNWALSDQLRDKLQAMGYAVQDTPQGMKVYKP